MSCASVMGAPSLFLIGWEARYLTSNPFVRAMLDALGTINPTRGKFPSREISARAPEVGLSAFLKIQPTSMIGSSHDRCSNRPASKRLA